MTFELYYSCHKKLNLVEMQQNFFKTKVFRCPMQYCRFGVLEWFFIVLGSICSSSVLFVLRLILFCLFFILRSSVLFVLHPSFVHSSVLFDLRLFVCS